MRIGITGATGYIGSHLAKACTEKGHEVIGFSRNPDRPPTEHIASFRRMTSLEELLADETMPPMDLSGLDALVHLAAEPIFGVFTPSKRERVWKSRELITRHLVKSAATLSESERPGVFLSASGIAYYGNAGDDWVDESSPRGEGWFPELTEVWEKEALAMEALGTRVVCARTGVVLGKKSASVSMFGKIFGMGAGGNLGNGKQWFSWIHIEDHVSMALQALEDESLRGPVNFTSPAPVRNEEMTRAIGAALNRPTIIPVPSFGVKLAFRELATELLDSHRVRPAVFEKAGFEFQYTDIESALREAFGK